MNGPTKTEVPQLSADTNLNTSSGLEGDLAKTFSRLDDLQRIWRSYTETMGGECPRAFWSAVKDLVSEYKDDYALERAPRVFPDFNEFHNMLNLLYHSLRVNPESQPEAWGKIDLITRNHAHHIERINDITKDRSLSSPLALLTQHSAVSHLMEKLDNFGQMVRAGNTDGMTVINFRDLETFRTIFNDQMLAHERGLHEFCKLLSNRTLSDNVRLFLEGTYHRAGRIEEFPRREISEAQLFNTPDFRLTDLLSSGGSLGRDRNLRVERSFIVYTHKGPFKLIPGVQKLISRVKSHESFVLKLFDTVFRTYLMPETQEYRSEKSSSMPGILKDALGCKIVCKDDRLAQSVFTGLFDTNYSHITWKDSELSTCGVDRSEDTKHAIVIPDFNDGRQERKSGYKSHKAYLMWANRVLELVVQSRKDFDAEFSKKSPASHRSYEQIRQQTRDTVLNAHPALREGLQILQIALNGLERNQDGKIIVPSFQYFKLLGRPAA